MRPRSAASWRLMVPKGKLEAHLAAFLRAIFRSAIFLGPIFLGTSFLDTGAAVLPSSSSIALASGTHSTELASAVDVSHPSEQTGQVDARAGTDPAEAEGDFEADDSSPLPRRAVATPIAFSAGLERAEVMLAEPFKLNIEIRHSRDEIYQLPDRLHLGDFSLREREISLRQGATNTTLIGLTLQAFAVGELEIPAFGLEVQTPQGAAVLEIPAQSIVVRGVIDFEQGPPQLREDNRSLPSRYSLQWWPLLLLAAVATGVLAAWGLWLYSKRPRPKPAGPPPPPPFEEAMARLAMLERSGLVAEGRKQDYFFRLSEIFRAYLGRRYEFDALELTTGELLRSLRSIPTPGLDLDLSHELLAEADLVKFARREPSDGQCKQALELVRQLIERSRPRPEAEGSAGLVSPNGEKERYHDLGESLPSSSSRRSSSASLRGPARSSDRPSEGSRERSSDRHSDGASALTVDRVQQGGSAQTQNPTPDGTSALTPALTPARTPGGASDPISARTPGEVSGRRPDLRSEPDFSEVSEKTEGSRSAEGGLKPSPPGRGGRAGGES